MVFQIENACWSQTAMLTVQNSILEILIVFRFLYKLFFKWTITLGERTHTETIWNWELRNQKREHVLATVSAKSGKSSWSYTAFQKKKNTVKFC